MAATDTCVPPRKLFYCVYLKRQAASSNNGPHLLHELWRIKQRDGILCVSLHRTHEHTLKRMYTKFIVSRGTGHSYAAYQVVHMTRKFTNSVLSHKLYCTTTVLYAAICGYMRQSP